MALSFFSLISKLVKKHSPMPFSWWKSAISVPLNGSAGYSISLLKRWLGQDMDSCPKLIISLISKLVKKHSPMPFSMLVKKCDSVAPERFSRVFHISSKEIARQDMDTFVLNLNLIDNVPLIVVGSIRSTLLHLKVGIKPSKDLGHKLTLHQLELPSAELWTVGDQKILIRSRSIQATKRIRLVAERCSTHWSEAPQPPNWRKVRFLLLMWLSDAQANSVSVNQSSADSKVPLCSTC